MSGLLGRIAAALRRWRIERLLHWNEDIRTAVSRSRSSGRSGRAVPDRHTWRH
ncbi:hypothetical protein [Actinocatenispora rupis]|uniref:Uncharacterized protein n=1 Tax=Actinocatenispora rupis TaxID=519421 RepID=A0A8J3NCT8_9ACTN|nr:hypothetical protein [Actinocatenispora rupis]GID12245.1 hypothetical protein Aru02nite_31340 [Actinocatenispora rupis]